MIGHSRECSFSQNPQNKLEHRVLLKELRTNQLTCKSDSKAAIYNFEKDKWQIEKF